MNLPGERESLPEFPAKVNKTVVEPVDYLPGEPEKQPEEGTALCLSGGGYRAMLFHAGVLWRLNEVGYLPKLKRISSVSGGSITAGVLAMNWKQLNFQDNIARNFEAKIVSPIKKLASRSIDVSSVLEGTFGLGSIGDKVADRYRHYLFGSKTLQDIPDEPRFVFNATNVQSGVVWRFMKPYMRDYRVGEVKNPTVELAVAIAASSAFPPVLSPVELDSDPEEFTSNSGTDLQADEFRTQVVLTDGGVYDNLGLETVWKRYKTILVSDGGAGFTAQADPSGDWIRHTHRILMMIDNQVRSLRKRQAVESFKAKIRKGAYWSITSDLAEDYNLADALVCPFEKTNLLAKLGTRLKKLDQATQEKLINWGYAVSDAGLRRYFDPALMPPRDFPYPNTGVG